eukprot:9880488-Prorocentrum_lima.AAC.1
MVSHAFNVVVGPQADILGKASSQVLNKRFPNEAPGRANGRATSTNPGCANGRATSNTTLNFVSQQPS